MVQKRRRDLRFGSREKKGFEGFCSKREEGIWGLVQERRRDLGLGSRDKKGFGGLVRFKREEGI